MALPDKNISANIIWYYAVCGESIENVAYRLQISTNDVSDTLRVFKLFSGGIQSGNLAATSQGNYKRVTLSNDTIHDVVWDDVANYVNINYNLPIKESFDGYLNRVYCNKFLSKRVIIPIIAVIVGIILIVGLISLVGKLGDNKPTTPPPVVNTPVDEPEITEPVNDQVSAIPKPQITMKVRDYSQENSGEYTTEIYQYRGEGYAGQNIDGEPSGYNLKMYEDGYEMGYMRRGSLVGPSIQKQVNGMNDVVIIGNIDESTMELNGLCAYKVNDKVIVGEFKAGVIKPGAIIYVLDVNDDNETIESIAEVTSTMYPDGHNFTGYRVVAKRTPDNWIKSTTQEETKYQGNFDLSDLVIKYGDSEIMVSTYEIEISSSEQRLIYNSDTMEIHISNETQEGIDMTYDGELFNLVERKFTDEGLVEQPYKASIEVITEEMNKDISGESSSGEDSSQGNDEVNSGDNSNGDITGEDSENSENSEENTNEEETKEEYKPIIGENGEIILEPLTGDELDKKLEEEKQNNQN